MNFKELYKYRYLLYELVVRDIKKKYRRSVLGVLWSVLNPLLMMAVTAMVFSTIFRFSIKNYIFLNGINFGKWIIVKKNLYS